MENQNQLTVKGFFERDIVQAKFKELLGKKAQGFVTSVLQVVNSNELLKKASPDSIFNAAATAATLDLPINNNLGFAYIVPYNVKQPDGSFKQVAQFQMGYKGFIQLAQRSGQFKTISATAIYEGQIIEENPLTGYVFDFKAKKSDTIIGYASYFELINGFQKTLYIPIEQMKAHGLKFSQTFKKGYGLWKDDFDSMAMKTAIKLLLSKFAPLSIEMQQAVQLDQSVINDNGEPDYVDHEEVITADSIADEKARQRAIEHIKKAKTPDVLNEVREHLGNDDELIELFADKMNQLQNK